MDDILLKMDADNQSQDSHEHNYKYMCVNGNGNAVMDDYRKDDIAAYRRKLYDDFVSNITLHGYVFIATEKGFRKLLWTVIVVLLGGKHFPNLAADEYF